MEKILKSTATVRFQHCDPYSVLFNSRYLDYFLNAREDQILSNYGINLYERFNSDGTAWVVGSNKISYFSPATLMEEVIITSKIINYTDKTLTVECVMYNQDETEVKAILWATFISFDLRSRKSTSLTADWKNLFEQVHYPVEQSDFDLRTRQVVVETKALQN